MGWPFAWGILLTVGFYGLLKSGIIDTPLTHRYFAAHPVQYLETALFFIGLAAITIKAKKILEQFGTLNEIEIVAKPDGGQPIQDVHGMLESLKRLPNYARQSYLGRRLEQALEFVDRKGAAEGLEPELKHLSEMDAERQHDGFALVRIIIWATPMLGFLGTVIGITLALSDLSPQALVSKPETAMDGLLGGLAVAFDTTALALILSIFLMFAQYLTNSLETELLDAVDRRVEAEFVGRFQTVNLDANPHVAAVQAMSRQVLDTMQQTTQQSVEASRAFSDEMLQSVESIVHRQAELWQGTVEEAQHAWNQANIAASGSLGRQLNDTLQDSMEQHVTKLTQAESDAKERAEQHWRALHNALSENAHIMQQQQSELARQGDVVLRAMDGIRQMNQMQNALNENLHALTVTGNLDETMDRLTGAVSLLNARLSPEETAVRANVYAQQRRDVA